MTVLRMETLGRVRLFVDGDEQPDPRSRRLVAVVAYLALMGETVVPRQELASRFWGEDDPVQALTNLRKVFFRLRARWPRVAELLRLGWREVRWAAGVRVEVDAREFERASRAVEEQDLLAALRRYRGPFLPGFSEEWVVHRRRDLERQYQAALMQVAARWEGEGRYEEAFSLLDEAPCLPCDADVCQSVLRLAALTGGPARVARAYQKIEARFAEVAQGKPPEGLAQLRRQLAEGGSVPEAGTAMVGRRREWQRLVALWQEAAQGQPVLAWVQGEAGIGKTMLVGEFVRWAQARGVQIRRGQASGLPGLPLLEPVLEALGEEMLVAAADGPAAAGQRLTPRAHVRDDAMLRAERFSRLKDALVDAQPVILVLDDFHRAREEVWAWLQYAVGRAGRTALMVVAVGRDDVRLLRRRRAFLAAAGSHIRCSVVALRPFTDDEAKLLLATREPVPAHVAEQVIARCQGNPFFLLETAWAWRERQDPAVPVPVPPTVLALLGEKVGTLPPGARRVLELAALLVRGTEESFLLGAAGAHPSAVAQLEQAHLIRREADGAVAVVNEPLREAVLARLTGRRRRELAGRLADRLLDMGGDDREVARLLGLAARTEEATEAWRRAAARSERSAGAHASPADLREAR